MSVEGDILELYEDMGKKKIEDWKEKGYSHRKQRRLVLFRIKAIMLQVE